jgi:WD40 repeat protein
MHRICALLALTALSLAPATLHPHAIAEPCRPQWLSTPGSPGTDGRVVAMTNWDPDGPGPATPVLVVGGYITVAGTQAANGVATYDPTSGTWAPLPASLGDYFLDLAATPQGELFAIRYTSRNTTELVQWTGTQWFTLATQQQFYLTCVAVHPSGDLYLGGAFSEINGVSANNIARWDRTHWHPLNHGTSGAIEDIDFLPNGDVVVVGAFTFAWPEMVMNVARWNGTDWAPFRFGIGPANKVKVLPNGNIAAATRWLDNDYSNGPVVAVWNGMQWSASITNLNWNL